METYAHFTNIRSHILEEIKQATASVYVAVAWLTDQKLFRALCAKAIEGLDVQVIIIDDAINNGSSVPYQELESFGGKLYRIAPLLTGNLMHNKFCVIDRNVTITGSYNWSARASSNHENITITKDDPQLASQFLKEFKRIKVQYHGDDTLKAFDPVVIKKRLQVIAGFIGLGELDQVEAQLVKINEYELSEELEQLVYLLETKQFATAEAELTRYLGKTLALTFNDEVGMHQLRWEISYLEIEIVSLENEKSLVEKIIADFIHTYTLAFGLLVLKLLQLKKELLRKQGNTKDSAAYQKAEEAYYAFDEQFKTEQKKKTRDLSPEEAEELKRTYRKAVVLCHPDKFTDPVMQKKAEAVFVELHKAYAANNLDKVRSILEELEKGNFDIDATVRITLKEDLIRRLDLLREKYVALTSSVGKLRRDETYRKVLSYQTLADFWPEEKTRLEQEIKKIEDELRK